MEDGSAKDAFLLILTPAREMNFMKPGDARDRLLQDRISEYASPAESLDLSYWKMLDYYYAGLRPTQNFALRKVLEHETRDHPTIVSLLVAAMNDGKRLCEIDHPLVVAVLEKCAVIRALLERELSVDETASAIAALGGFGDAALLARALTLRPVGRDPEPDEEGAEFEQKTAVAAVDLMTIVGAKGLSADHVIVLGCDEVNFTWISRNAFFVAMTRARISLTLMACLGGGGATSLHEFLSALPRRAHASDVRKGGWFCSGGRVRLCVARTALQDRLR